MQKYHLPSFQFYPADWLGDLELQSCSAAARGAWINLISLMFKSESNYSLIVNRNGCRTPIKKHKLRFMANCSGRAVDELIENGVMRCSERRQVFYSKRLLRDKHKRIRDAIRQRSHRAATQNVTSRSRSSSTSSSSSTAVNKIPPKGGKAPSPKKLSDWELATSNMKSDILRTDAIREAWGNWCTVRREKRKPIKPTAAKLQIKRLEEMGHDRAIATLEYSAGNQYDGLIEPQTDRKSAKRADGSGHTFRQSDDKLKETIVVKRLN